MTDHDLVLVVDFGAQYAQLIARRVREARVYSEIVPHTMPVAEMLAKRPEGDHPVRRPVVGLRAGRPAAGRRRCSTAGVPVFGICYGFQAMALALGGEVARTGLSRVRPDRRSRSPTPAPCSPGCPREHRVWMSHGDAVAAAPGGFTVLASTAATPVAAFEDLERRLAGVQWHPEVLHTEHGQQVLEHFLLDIAGCRPTWTMVNIVEEQVEQIRAQVGDQRAICGLSGGVDSAVAAALVQRAIGDQLTCVFVDHGLLRKGEAEQVERDFVAATGVSLQRRRCREAVPRRAGRGHRPRGEAQDHRPRVHPGLRGGRARDRRRAGDAGRAGRVPRPGHALPRRGRVRRRRRRRQHQVATTTSAACPRTSSSSSSSRCAPCSRTRSALVGEQLGLPAEIVWRQPFPGPGLGIRIIGEVTAERLEILREADAIAREELTTAGLDRDIWQFPVVLLADVRSVGVQGDGRTYGHPVVLRPVTSARTR